jgi:D-serine deaminase-like pyridoxal phosphate-dependent protein
MADKADEKELLLRPHFKTHQSAEIGQWFRDEEVTCCTVSSVKMAEYFAEFGWDDILIAFPVNVLEAERIAALAEKVKLQLLLYSTDALKLLQERVSAKIGIKIELDVGSKRSGLRTNQHEEIDELLRSVSDSPNFHFTGFYSHPGHTYTSRSREEVIDKYDRIIEELEMLKASYGHTFGFSITVGDTPGCTLVEDFGPIEEISPGNFVFYDAMQVGIGTCTYDDIAVVMACPVVGKNEERSELLIHGGAVHFSKEVIQYANSIFHFGNLAKQTPNGWEGYMEGCYLKSISQEHGLVHVSDNLLQNAQIGDVIYVYPAHSCLAADLMKSYLTTGELNMQGKDAFMP